MGSMGSLVTGIAASEDGGVEDALRDAGLPLEPLTVISGEEGTVTDTLARTRGEIVMGTTGTGTGVPGLTTTNRELGIPESPLPAHERLRERLGGLEIPDDEIENYVEALERGHTVIGYLAPPHSVNLVADIFRALGVAKVKVAG